MTILNRFEWLLADDENIVFEKELEEIELTVEDLLKDGYVRKTQGNNEVYYSQRIGDMWIGRKKEHLT